MTCPALLASSNVCNGCKRLTNEFRHWFVLRLPFYTTPLLDEGINRHVSDHVEVIEQPFGILVGKIGVLKECSAHPGSDATCLRVGTGRPHSHAVLCCAFTSLPGCSRQSPPGNHALFVHLKLS
jgi:hypothetical protein